MDGYSRIVKVDIKHETLKDRIWPEIRIDTGITVAELKDKLYIKTGTSPSSMALSAHLPNHESTTSVSLDMDEESLYKYGIDEGYVILVRELRTFNGNKILTSSNENKNVQIDISNSSLKYTNPKLYDHYIKQTERVEATGNDSEFQRYQMSDEDYRARNTGVREFIDKMRAGAAKSSISSNAKNADEPTSLEDLREAFPIGSRCSVSPGDRRGEVKFVGLIGGKKVKIGVALDEPLGNSDGTFHSVKYFETHGSNYGGFYDPKNVAVGDFPQFDISDFL
ncbi:CAP-Gly domain containing protein [Theileria equi strain WA]|uniref:CAP-Gly domain containing protein n=1 Tax=Theileria equi strain WA TaxID=1537102 RepID=L0AXB3_THEEQ|nr:CAP-Gly domain containing protein [Theileria equi strain WA]AFZ80222.1 CAP-Gly domain containing protein [Theileria equi strain WA]|eukprot:XP_004829888.1 CAP-Gly domain containing protein [Theileria equi strain WA]